MGESSNIPSRAFAELALALRRAGVDISGLSHTEMLKKYVEPYLKAAGEGNEGAAMVKANMELVKGMTPQRRIGLAEDISKIDYSGINPSLGYSLGDHYFDASARSRNFRDANWWEPDYGIKHYGHTLPNHAQEKIAGLIMPYRYIDLSNPEYNKRLSDNYGKLMGMDIGYSGVEGLGNILGVRGLEDYLYNEFAYDTARRKFLNYDKETVKAILDYAREKGLKKLDGTPWVPSAEEIMRSRLPFGNGMVGPGIKKREISPLSWMSLEWVPKFGKDVQVDPVMDNYRFFQFRDYNGDIWTSSNPIYVQRYTDHPYSIWKTYHSGENMLTAPRLPMINLGYTYKNLPFVFNKEKGILEFHPDFKLNLTEQYKKRDPELGEGFPRPGDPEEGTYIQQFKNGDPERISKAWGEPTEMTVDDLLLTSKENGFSGIILPDFYGNQTWRVYNPDVEVVKAPSWEPAWVTAYKMTKHKRGGKLIPKHQKVWNPLGYLSKIFKIGSEEAKEISTLKESGNFLTGLTNKESAMMAKLSHLSASEQKKIYDFYKLSPNNYKPHLQRWILNGKVTDYESLLKAENAIKKGLESGIDLQLIKDYTTIKGYDEGVYKSNKYIEDASNGMLKFRFQTPGYGYRIFDVLNSKEGALAMRSILDQQYGSNTVPWCLSNHGDIEMIGTGNSWWEHYNGVPKRMVFDKNGNLLYFHANSSPIGLYWNMQDVSSTGLGREQKTIKNERGSRIISTSINPETGEKYTDYETTTMRFPKGGGIFSSRENTPNGNTVQMHWYDNNDRLITADIKDYSPKHTIWTYDMPGYLGKRTYDLNGKPLYLSIYRKVNGLRYYGGYWVPEKVPTLLPCRFKVNGLNGAYQYGLDTGRLIGHTLGSSANEASEYLKLSFNNHPIAWGFGVGALGAGALGYGLYKFYDQKE